MPRIAASVNGSPVSARDDALVRQDVGQRGRLRVQAAAHPIAGRGREAASAVGSA